jgi:hypothetical protein
MPDDMDGPPRFARPGRDFTVYDILHTPTDGARRIAMNYFTTKRTVE